MPIIGSNPLTPIEGYFNQKAQAFTPDPGYPASISVTGTPAAVLRYTITAVAWPRRFSLAGSSHLAYSQSSDVSLRWFNGATPCGNAQRRMVATVGDTLTATGWFDLAAGATSVLELRVTRVAGTGLITNSISDATMATVVAVPN